MPETDHPATSAVLLDANVLIALAVADHVHHEAAESWFTKVTDEFATCPITQGALVRLVMRFGGGGTQATTALDGITGHRSHRFWPDDLGYDKVPMTGVVGHRQITDAYLAALARAHGGRLATFDQGLAALHPDVAEAVPTT